MSFLLIVSLLFWSDSQTISLEIEDAGLSFQLPEAWDIAPNSGPFAALAQRPPRDALAMVSRSAMSMEKAEEHYLKGLGQSFESHEIHGKAFVQLGKHKVRQIMLSGKRGEITLRHLTYIVEGFGESFSMTFATKGERYADLEPELQQIAGSMVFNGPPNHEETQAFLAAVIQPKPDFAQLEALLEKGARIDAQDAKGKTALIHAAVNRNGPLAKWLLANGSDMDHKNHGGQMLQFMAPPPIKTLFKMHKNGGKLPEEKAKKAGALELSFRSPERQLLVGITNRRPSYVKAAIAEGADLTVKHENYQLPPLALTRQLIKEYREIDLDPGSLLEIERLIEAASR